MAERRTLYEIYWEILVYCRTPRAFTAIINRCDLNSKSGQEHVRFLCAKGYLSQVQDGERVVYTATERAGDYIAKFAGLYMDLFDSAPEFRL